MRVSFVEKPLEARLRMHLISQAVKEEKWSPVRKKNAVRVKSQERGNMGEV